MVDDAPHDENEVVVVESSETPVTPTTSKPITPTEGAVVPSGEPCSGHFQSHPEDCNAYQVCEHGQWLDRHCAAGLHWNGVSLHCDWPTSAGCSVDGGSGISNLLVTCKIENKRVLIQFSHHSRFRSSTNLTPSNNNNNTHTTAPKTNDGGHNHR